jgi:hypothetical protein
MKWEQAMMSLVILNSSIMKRTIFFILWITPILLHAQKINYLDGECKSGNCQDGTGTFEFTNGDKYYGGFRNGKINGLGKYEYAKTGASYNGLWINGQREDDNATYKCTNYEYTGGYKNNKQNGYATIRFIKGDRAGDTFRGEFIDGSFKIGIYTYSKQHPDRKQYDGAFSKNKFNGKGVLTYKNNDKDDGIWKDGVFLGTNIGRYGNEDVLKKGDTILVVKTGKKYLLSKQTVMADVGLAHQLNEYLPKGAFIIETDLQGGIAAIGYVTTSGNVPDLSLYGEVERYAKASTGHKFYELREQIGTYKGNPVYKRGNTIIAGDNEYELGEQAKGTLGEQAEGDIANFFNKGLYLIAKKKDDTNKKEVIFNILDFIGIVKNIDGKYSFNQVNTKQIGVYENPGQNQNQPVIYFKDLGIVVIGNLSNSNRYVLAYQIRQQSFLTNDDVARFYLLNNQNRVPSESEWDVKNLIGWVDLYYNTEEAKFYNKNKTNRIDGVNLFGSIYIGPNNPKYPNGKSSYELAYQDTIDYAAKLHDQCYDDGGAVGTKDALINYGVIDCDIELVVRCFKTLHIQPVSNIDSSQSLISLIKNKFKDEIGFSLKLINDARNIGEISDINKRAKYVAIFFSLVATTTKPGKRLIDGALDISDKKNKSQEERSQKVDSTPQEKRNDTENKIKPNDIKEANKEKNTISKESKESFPVPKRNH